LGQFYPQGIRGKLALWRQRRSLDNVSAILTDSQASKRDIIDLFKIRAEKVFVTPLAADPAYTQKPSDGFLKAIKAKYSLPDKFILYVGGVNANKNLVRLARAAISTNINLVLVGSEFIKPAVETFSIKKLLGLQKTHPEIREFQKLKKLIEGNSLFQTPGFVPTEELNAIYRLAAIYCQPSLYEGFGLPVLEAMTTGCLVACADTGSLPEIYPPGTIIFSPQNQTEIEGAIKRALSLPPKEKTALVALAKQRAKDFSWEKTAKLTQDVYLSVLS
jgi:glycosyltransferase involved in cell wall biosynthesis